MKKPPPSPRNSGYVVYLKFFKIVLITSRMPLLPFQIVLAHHCVKGSGAQVLVFFVVFCEPFFGFLGSYYVCSLSQQFLAAPSLSSNSFKKVMFLISFVRRDCLVKTKG